MSSAYAELHCLSDFSFGRGASSARELFERAAHCGYRALAITDECSLAGIVRAHEAARDTGVKLIIGTEVQLDDGLRLVLLVRDRDGYAQLCRLITRGRRRATKGTYHLSRHDLATALPGLLALWLPGVRPDPAHGAWVRDRFPQRAWLAVELLRDGDDTVRLDSLTTLARELGMPAVAAGDVHMHVRSRRALQDTLTAIRHRRTLVEARGLLFRNGERHLRHPRTLEAVYPAALRHETLRIAARCRFSLDQLQYRYPAELVPAGHTPASWLRHLAGQGLRRHWPDGPPEHVRALVERELALIAELGYEAYFLTVHDIVRFARERGILCQGRGSAANSATCFALGITAVDPSRTEMLIERFISRERNEPPDIDVDFEHERREEVIQYVYRKYGRERAALAATVIFYRGKSAVRDAGGVLGLPVDLRERLTRALGRWDGKSATDETLRQAGFDPDSTVLRRVMQLASRLHGHPRHLSQHVGGFVISDAPLDTLVPVENAAMAERTIIQWDKDDLDALGLLKVDCLALGMLTALRKCLDLLRRHARRDLELATIPAADEATYAMLRRADTIGVFQVESRAQMSMLPRLQPRHFYDLVIQIAIVRPGPIQGDMVHPYLARRRGTEAVTYPSDDVRKVLERTLGIPLFQEQVMKLAIIAAGYSGGEADQLRRSMAAWKRHGNIEIHRERITRGMLERGYTPQFAAELFDRLKGFGSYGFPESHATSFALLAYASAWLKCHEPAAFTCAVLNALPMGFYSESQLVQDARQHGIEVRPVAVEASDWDCTLEPFPDDLQRQPALRLGMRLVRGMDRAAAIRLTVARTRRPFTDIDDLVTRAGLEARTRRLLAGAGALRHLAGHRHRARWLVSGIEPQRPLFGHAGPAEPRPLLAPPATIEDTLADYAGIGLTLGPHPVRQIRPRLEARRYRPSHHLRALAGGTHVRTAGLVTLRQRPMTAGGTTFVTLEDEYGSINVIIWRRLAERQRAVLLDASLLGVDGRWESAEGVQHLVARRLHDCSALLGSLRVPSHDYH